MRSELIMQLVRYELSLLVVGVVNPLHQFVVGAVEPIQRPRETVDFRIEVADLRRTAILCARRILTGFELRERRSRDAKRADRAPNQKARHADGYERHEAADQRILLRFVPDLVDLVRWVGDQDDGFHPAILHRNRDDRHFRRSADKGAKPVRRLGLAIRLPKN